MSKAVTPVKILKSGDAPPFFVLNGRSRRPFLIVCDHASNAVPTSLGRLGLSPSALEKHIAVDIGTGDIGRYCAEKLGVTAVFASYSRLVMDLNRSPGHFTSILDVSDHVRIPRNFDVSRAERQARYQELFLPYHAEIARQLDRLSRDGGVEALFFLSIHSFTPVMDGKKRPWQIGILWDDDGRMAVPLLGALRQENPDFTIGDNEPYSARDQSEFNYTCHTHAKGRGLAHVTVEFRQDLIDTPKKARAMANRFLKALLPILEKEGVGQPTRPVRTRTASASRRAASRKPAKNRRPRL